jgi:hypothetical protein
VARNSQAILGPLLGVIQDMYLDDTYKGREGYCDAERRRTETELAPNLYREPPG